MSDLDAREASCLGALPSVEAFDMFMRLMDEPQWEGLLFGDISAINGWRRVGLTDNRYLLTILNRDDLHHRLVYGSDYPVPAANFVVSTRVLYNGGFITQAEREALNEVYRYNPLLFDLMSKRLMVSPETGKSFPADLFTRNLFGVEPKPPQEDTTSDIGPVLEFSSDEALPSGAGTGQKMMTCEERGITPELPFCFCIPPSEAAQMPTMPSRIHEGTPPVMPTVPTRPRNGRAKRMWFVR